MANLVKKNQSASSITSIEAAEKIAKHMNLSEAQSAEFTGMSMQIANVANVEYELDNEIRSIAESLRNEPDPRVLKLREYKKRRKQILLAKDAMMNSYSGAMRVFLADVPGAELSDKYKALGM